MLVLGPHELCGDGLAGLVAGGGGQPAGEVHEHAPKEFIVYEPSYIPSHGVIGTLNFENSAFLHCVAQGTQTCLTHRHLA